MGLLGGAVLAIWNDVAAGGEAEFDHWHTREHIPERVGVPGFLRGRRYVALSGAPAYFTLYETERLETLSEGAYIARLNDPTPWTSRALPLFRNTSRSACRVTFTRSLGVGGTLATLRLGPVAGREDALRGWLTTRALPALAEAPGIVGAHLVEAEAAATRVPTRERALRSREDEIARWVVLVESGTPAPMAETVAGALGPEALDLNGAAPGAALGVYRLLYCLGK
jgi:hypothetical protein